MPTHDFPSRRNSHSAHQATPIRSFDGWLFLPAIDRRLDESVRHRDEPLRPTDADSARAEYLVRSSSGSSGVEVFVRGVVLRPGALPVALAGWHRAVRIPAIAREPERRNPPELQ